MSYHKPELFALCLAVHSVHGMNWRDLSGEFYDSGVKIAGKPEAGGVFYDGATGNLDLGAATSTTAAAYEADE